MADSWGTDGLDATARSFVVAVALGLTCFPACAQSKNLSTAQVIKQQAPKGITKAFYACIEKADANSDHDAMSACESAERKVQDARLNAVYKSVLGKLAGQEMGDLVNAQRAWLEFHRKSESVEFSVYGGNSDTVSRSESGFEIDLQTIFRLCERANTLDRYLSLAKE